MSNRIRRLQHILSSQRLDSLFISNQYNVSYLTGFAGLSPQEREGFLFVTKTDALLLTFPTYFGLFKTGGDAFRSVCITPEKRLSHRLGEIIDRDHLTRIGYEPDNLTVSELDSLEKNLSKKLIPARSLVENLRRTKDEAELSSIRKSARITDQAFDFIKTKIKTGVSEKELAMELEFFIKKNAGDIAFPPIVAFDGNAAIPHYLPSNTQLSTINNHLILLDFGAKYDGYCADMTRVVFYKTPPDQFVKIYQAVSIAQQKALAALKPGVSGSAVDAIARESIRAFGFPTFAHGLGHGVGLAIHEAPRLKADTTDVLQAGDVVTVEPGIYLEDVCGVRIEDLVVLTNSGYEMLSKSTKEIIIL